MRSRPLKIGFINIQGLKNYVEEVEDWIQFADLNITAAIETKLLPEKAINSHMTTISARQPSRLNSAGRPIGPF